MRQFKCDERIWFWSGLYRFAFGCGLLIGVPTVAQSSGDGVLPTLNSVVEASGTHTISDVRIEGNTTIDASGIFNYIKTGAGQTVTASQIKADEQALIATLWFEWVEAIVERTPAGKVLVFRVAERPMVTSVEYRGNRKLRPREFKSMTQLVPGQPYCVDINRKCAARIEEFYIEKGYRFATVDLERGAEPGNNFDVAMAIREGPRVVTDTFQFASDAQTLTRRIRSRLDPDTFDADLAAIRQYYQDRGYFDAKISHERLPAQDTARIQYVQYIIDEGTQYFINEITVIGNEAYSDRAVIAAMDVKSGDAYDERRISRSRIAIQTMYKAERRLAAKVNVTYRRCPQPDRVDLIVNVEEERIYPFQEDER